MKKLYQITTWLYITCYIIT